MGCYVGEWRTNGESFSVKSHALIKATEFSSEVSYHYYDEIFASVDVTGLGRIPLATLYRQRALQLRESYDYLILNYSGGADSRNILDTFLDNNIKLDCVFVKWPLQMVGKNIYPIVTDPDQKNYLCEWDLVIKPDLDRLKTKHPEIRIELVDWSHDLGRQSFADKMFDDLHHFTYMTNMLRVPSSSQIEKELCEKGKKVASIYGVDKPVMGIINDGRCYLRFTDTATTVNPPRVHNPNGTEYFYWTPDFPSIPFEQCAVVLKYLRENPRHRTLFDAVDQSGHTAEKWSKQQQIIKWLIYPSYDPTVFQAEKPLRNVKFLGVPKDFYFETHPEIEPYKKIWHHGWSTWMQQIDDRFYYPKIGYFKTMHTRAYYVGRL